MANLFILGNGFDMDHNMQTRYSDFKNFLEDQCHSGSALHDPRIIDLFSRLSCRLDANWSNLEQELGFLDFTDEISCYTDEIADGYDEGYIAVTNMISTAGDILNDMEPLEDIFAEWVKTIEIYASGVKRDFADLISSNEDRYCLSFNYTATLEKLYNVDEVCHIHILNNDRFLLGHGEELKNLEVTVDNFPNISDYTLGHGNFDEIEKIERTFNKIHNILKKDVSRALSDHQAFFEGLRDIEKVYSYGFSYGDVDLVYIKRILSKINGGKFVTWFLNDYNEDDNRIFERKIRSCGFKGDFGRFSINN
jgi:hypothetical protein